MEMRDLMKPGVMLSNIWPQAREVEGETLQALEQAVALDFFEAIQVVDIPFPDKRLCFAEVLCGHGLAGNMAMTRILNLNRLNLSSPDASLRRRSVAQIVDQLDHVRQAGVGRCTIVSGPRPDDQRQRGECLALFQDSDVVELMVAGHRRGLFTQERRPTAAFEILRSEKMDGVKLPHHCRDLFQRCWQAAAFQLESPAE